MNRIAVLAPVSVYCRAVHAEYWRCRPERYAVIANGVDTARFKPDRSAGQRWREKLGIQNRRVILYVGRACAQKGTDLLPDAWAYWKSRVPGAILALVGPAARFGNSGGDPTLDRLVADGAVHVPPVDDSELPAVYNMADVFIMPTRRLEMFGMAAVEAQACGVPVVASDQGGLRETVPESAGVRFRPGDSADLARTVQDLLYDSEKRRRLGAGALANAAQYDWMRIAERCEELYLRAAHVSTG
jgi:glycosyltransferase involved in cell wall biosynthesis